jgi:S-disulfanyl-L-cysteine oxidoreductase SoxD
MKIAFLMGLATIGLMWAQTRSVLDGVYTQEQATRGHDLYIQSCAVCHGNGLEGGEEAPALAGGDFISNWNGLTAGDLFERMRATMPHNKPGSLTRETHGAILAYILSVNKYPAGQTELSSQAEVLKQIRIDPPKSEKK